MQVTPGTTPTTVDTAANSMSCPLCGATGAAAYHHDRFRSYRQCNICGLVFVPPDERLSAVDEKSYYDQHENELDDPGYRRFLSRLAHPLLERLTPGASGLDFGCGPGPAMACMLRAAGMHVDLYDPFYSPDTSVLNQQYDFITCTEVLEHLHRPGAELDRLFAMLKPSGWLGIMTKRVRDQKAFGNWHYIRDPTHVVFLSEASLTWIADHWRADLELPADDIALMHKRIPAHHPSDN